MGIVKAIKTANRIKRFERRHNANVQELLNNLTDPTFLERANKPEPVQITIIVSRQQILRAVYSKDRNIIQ